MDINNYHQAVTSTNPETDIKNATQPGIFLVVTPQDHKGYLALAMARNTKPRVIAWDQNGHVQQNASLPTGVSATITRLEEQAWREFFEQGQQKAQGQRA